MKTIFYTILGLIFFMSSCSLIKKDPVSVPGDTSIESKEFNIEDFSKITLTGNQEIYYEQRADLQPYLRIETDENLFRFFTPIVKKKELTFEKMMEMSPSSFKIYTNSRNLTDVSLKGSGNAYLDGIIKVKNLNIEIEGSGSVIVENLQVKSLSVEIPGTGYAELKGTASSTTYDISGSGTIKADNLVASNVKCKLSGAGNMWVYANKSLLTNLSGSGDIIYKGEPADIRKKLTGVGTITPAEQ
jgi:hypothetical protein